MKPIALMTLAVGAVLTLSACASNRPRQGRSLAATAPQQGMNLWHVGLGATVTPEQTLPAVRVGYTRSVGERTSLHGRLETLVVINDVDLFVRYRLLDALGLDMGLASFSILVPGQATWTFGPRLGVWTSKQFGEFVLGAGLAGQFFMPCLTGAWLNAEPPRPACLAPVLRPQVIAGIPAWRHSSLDVILGGQLGLQSDGVNYGALDLGLGVSW